MLHKKHLSGDSNPNSSTSCYHSGNTTGPDSEQQFPQLIMFDSPIDSKATTSNIDLTNFDPLLLMDPYSGSTSGSVSTSPSMRRQTPPRSPSINDLQLVKCSPICRPRPRPRPHHKSDMSLSDSVKSLIVGGTTGDNDLGDYDSGYGKSDSNALSTYSSSFEIKSSPIIRARHRWRRLYGMSRESIPTFSPLQPNQKSDVSPSGSVQSLIVGSTMGDRDFGDYDSDHTSTYDSLIDLSDVCELEDPLPLPVPSKVNLDTLNFDFDLQKNYFK